MDGFHMKELIILLYTTLDVVSFMLFLIEINLVRSYA